MSEDISIYLSGSKLYGDDFTIDQIEEWFKDEAEGYADLGAKEKEEYQYDYNELNNRHAFKHLQNRSFKKALGIGSAYGYELKPILESINEITILDPSDAFSDVHEVLGTSCKYIKPDSSGDMPFEDAEFDLITSLGVLHHIPNVSHVMSESYRCIESGGIMLLREPIVSMGDWTKVRKGLTKRERGIPFDLLDEIVRKTGFKVIKRSLCVFPMIPVLANKVGVSAYNNYFLTLGDAFLSKLFSSNIKYHRTKLYEKFAPASIYYILEK